MPLPSLIDSFGRKIDYVRLSITDRCDFRCVYCMSETMQFLPRHEVLSLEEFSLIGQAFHELGVNKLRITGGEPLIRQNVIQLFKSLNQLPNLRDLTLTTNGSQLARYAQKLAQNGVKRVNVSLDSLDADTFKKMTRTGNLDIVLEGIQAAIKAGLKVKLNAVILKHQNMHEAKRLCEYALQNNVDVSFIEEMPLGEISSHSRQDEHINSESLREYLSHYFQFSKSTKNTHGPSRYWRLGDSDVHIGFISPHSENFCESCNRVRVTAQGRLLLCLGNEHSIDLRHIIRNTTNPLEPVKKAIVNAMTFKPLRHEFNLDQKPDIVRFMNATGG